MVHVERVKDTSVIRMCRQTANAINLEMVEALGEALDSATKDDSRAIVLTSDNDKFFAIGFNLPELLKLDREGFTHFYRSYNDLCLRLFTTPKPVIAALRGHATAGGCILALCCDRRIIASGRKLIGLNEILLGLPVPYLSALILHDVAGGRATRRVIETGALFAADEAMELGLVDEVVSPDEVEERSLELANELGAMPGRSWWANKVDRVTPIEEAYRRERAAKESKFLDCWFSSEARVELEKAATRFR